MQGNHRRIPMHRLKFVTKESNRLSNYTARYAYLAKELNVEKNKELGVEPEDVRWDDRRYLHYKCQKCGEEYRKMQSAMVRYRDFCPRCAIASPTTLGTQIKSETVAAAFPKLLQELGAKESSEYVGGLSGTSRAIIQWKCKSCPNEYSASVRSRTGKIEEGQAPFSRLSASDGHCADCRWAAAMKGVAAQAIKNGSYLGLEDSFAEVSKPSKR